MIEFFCIAVLCAVAGIAVDRTIAAWEARAGRDAERRALEREEALDRYWERYRRRRAERKAAADGETADEG